MFKPHGDVEISVVVFFDGIHLTIQFKRTTGMAHLIIKDLI
jgi:hypothetical protein